MALTRTSRSRLFDRVVRVERRHRNRDFMGGSFADYETIIPRYHVRLWPDTHRRRQREETGEVLADPQAFRALGNPSHNGRTIMYGDRFVDDKNHQCYKVVSVWRPKGRAGWSLTNQFELRIIEDCPQAAAAVGSAIAGTAGADAGGAQQHFILRHFGQDQLAGWESLPYFDGFVYNLQTDDPADLLTLANAVASGKRWFRYYNVQSYPYSGTELGGLTPPLAAWFNWLRDNVQFLGTASHRRMRVATQVALFPGSASPLGQQYELIPWGVCDPAERQAAVQQMADLANNPGSMPLPVQGVFLDQAWLKVEGFQVESNLFAESGHGDTQESGPPLTALSFGDTTTAFGDGGPWTTHTTAMMDLYAAMATALPAGQYAIKNGEHREQNGQRIPKPWYFENAWDSNVDGGTQPDRWAFAKAEFATDQRNVLSILCSAAPNATIGVPEAIDHWEQVGGWLAFTHQGDPGDPGDINAEIAYAEAAARLAQLGWPR